MGIKSEAVLLFRKFITSKTSPLVVRNLYTGNVLDYSENEKMEKSSKKKSSKPTKQTLRSREEIYNFFKAIDWSKQYNFLPIKMLMKKKSMPDNLYLFDIETAKIMIDSIKDDLLADPNKIIEVNAGIGVLTEELLAAGVPEIRVMESNIEFISLLSNKHFAKQLILHEGDVSKIWKLSYKDKYEGKVPNIFADIPTLEWGEETGLKIIGTVTNVDFINHMTFDVIRQCGLVNYGRPCLYLAVPPRLWTQITCEQALNGIQYRGNSVLFQLLFDYKLLRKVPRKSFLPWIPTYNEKAPMTKSKRAVIDKDCMYIVKIEGKKNLFSEIIDLEYLKPLWYFLNHHLTSRSNRVIPQLEMWEPGCGPSLIMEDLNVYTQFGDLSPEQILHIFKKFTAYDGYQNTFIPTMENTIHKMEQLLF